ncbi:vWA domain-containing protein [Motiliproteus sp.]|uniref:vWA domain-containing protein n=1 Tax=Motiliproteus sp. TaxID=1898955 RepID=UPI003BAAF5AF
MYSFHHQANSLTETSNSYFKLTPLALTISLVLLSGCAGDRQDQTAVSVEPDQSQRQAQAAQPAGSHQSADKAAEVQPALPVIAKPQPRLERKRELREQSYNQQAIAQPRLEAESLQASPQQALAQSLPQAMPRATMGKIATTDALHSPPVPLPIVAPYPIEADSEQYAEFRDNPIKSTAVDPLSTFGVDVDTASYSLTRQSLNSGVLPRPESVRTEEWLNYFDYDYPRPESQQQPFSVTTELARAPWDQDRMLLSIGLQGYEVDKADLPPLNLTYLIDVSGSMHAPNKLPLAVNALKMLTRQLRPQDRVAITVYAGAAGLVLEPTDGTDKTKIIAALDRLRAGGSTAGGAGIRLAYNTAKQHHTDGAISRVILVSDGDFNVGTRNTDELKRLIEKERESDVSLSVMTLGRGNIRDELMNTLAETGNGTAAYIDSAIEAKKHLVDGMSGTLMTIAKDVKAQIEFNPAVVSEYRLLGYETRHLEHHEFNDDRKDAGDIGAGHRVTALYELITHDSPARLNPQRRYRQASTQSPTTGGNDTETLYSNELAYLKLRYKLPGQSRSTLISQPIYRDQLKAVGTESDNLRWSAAVAGAAQYARGVESMQDWSFQQSQQLARQALGEDHYGYRAEFVRLLGLASDLDQPLRADLR